MKTIEKLGLWLLLPALCSAVILCSVSFSPAELSRQTGVFSEGAKLNINRADKEALEDLPGIGPALAEEILTRQSGPAAFRSPADLLSVPGIGEARLAAVEAYITY